MNVYEGTPLPARRWHPKGVCTPYVNPEVNYDCLLTLISPLPVSGTLTIQQLGHKPQRTPRNWRFV